MLSYTVAFYFSLWLISSCGRVRLSKILLALFDARVPLDHYIDILKTNRGARFATYRKISNIRRTISPNLNVSRLVLQLSLPNPMKPGVKSRMKM